MNIFSELKRRNVFRVAIAYAVVAWLLIQVADTLGDTLALPDWTGRLVVLLLVLGFVPAVVFSWIYELTPEGIRKESEVSDGASTSTQTARRLDLAVIVLLVTAMGLFVADRFLRGDSAPPAMEQLETIPANEEVATAAPLPSTDRSIAVLPFLNLSNDPEQEFFSDGLADTLLHRLAQVPDLRVAARTSSFKFKGENEDVRAIASQLGVATVLEGSVQRQGNRVRITAQLIDAEDGSHLWSKVFDDTLDDIFRVQDEIAQEVAEALAGEWQGQAADPNDPGSTDNVAAYEAYLRGVDALSRRNMESASEALIYLERAVELDPSYAKAWVALSRAHTGAAEYGLASWESTYGPRMEAAERALELAPELAGAHLAVAEALEVQGLAPERVAAEIARAVELAPNDPAALMALAGISGVRDALDLTERAVARNPLDPNLRSKLAEARLNLGMIDQALAEFDELAEGNPGNVRVLLDYSSMLRMTGHLVEAVRVGRSTLERQPGFPGALFNLLWHYAAVEDYASADRYLRRIETLAPERAFDDRAFLCLLTGAWGCYQEYAEKFRQLQLAEGANSQAALYQAVALIQQGDPTQAVALLEPRADEVIQRGTIAYPINASMMLALAYDRVGKHEARDRILDEQEANTRERLKNGAWPAAEAYWLMRIAAIRGDGQAAAERLAAALDGQFHGHFLGQLKHSAVYDRVRDHPDFQAQIERLEAWAARMRAELELLGEKSEP